MTDKELLEKAAKAAGIDFRRGTLPHQAGMLFVSCGNGDGLVTGREWNPLTDDGDALRLAVKLRFSVDPWGSGAAAVVSLANRAQCAEPHYGDDPERATRRAIVRAAAALADQQ
jgi:hypothetical protein